MTEAEQRFVAIALQGLCFRQGPETFAIGWTTAQKLGVDRFLEEYLKDWMAYVDEKVEKNGGPAQSDQDN